ncbi:MAG: DUF1049 domain-containing protein [Rhodospirillales bacterium]|nr:DUF1049 domain-containing protein [Rhodospirillales bacterium]
MGFLRTGLLVAITILSTIFVIQNLASVEVSFLTWSIVAPRAAVFALLLLLGLVAGYLLHAIQMALRPRRTLDHAASTSDPAAPGSS